jgi:hypothetical protein
MVIRQARKQPANRLVVQGSPRRVDLMLKNLDSEARAKVLIYLEDYYPDEFQEILDLMAREEEE